MTPSRPYLNPVCFPQSERSFLSFYQSSSGCMKNVVSASEIIGPHLASVAFVDSHIKPSRITMMVPAILR
ncbi:hypothetical protein A0H81_03395 [Grifola frondosa]|uniref:Uncharacterized protein n=1 Tax=Grifola frondosa TaxID=5627 RepID=A0A1C7MIJ9_GRIFR|nr:hypothetical protein A0H81_03395 [Grifola frondosa]